MPSLHKWLSTGLFQPLGNPLVQAFALLQSGYIHLAVQGSRQAKHEPSGERFIRLFISFQAKFQIVVTRQEQRDEMSLRLELKNEIGEEAKKKLAVDLNDRFQNVCRVRIDTFEFVKAGTIGEPYQKIVDRRVWK